MLPVSKLILQGLALLVLSIAYVAAAHWGDEVMTKRQTDRQDVPRKTEVYTGTVYGARGRDLHLDVYIC